MVLGCAEPGLVGDAASQMVADGGGPVEEFLYGGQTGRRLVRESLCRLVNGWASRLGRSPATSVGGRWPIT